LWAVIGGGLVGPRAYRNKPLSGTSGTLAASNAPDRRRILMATINERGHADHPHSTAKIGGHPIHPMLIPFPIVCFIGALVTDIVFLNNQDPGWATASRWLLGIGIVMAALAAVAGLTDFMGDDRIRRTSDALKHMLANVTAVVLEIVNFFVRLHNDSAIGGLGIILSAIVVLILLYSGWKGGDLVFRHGIGVEDDASR
jgi:uncharacterized membrane protein